MKIVGKPDPTAAEIPPTDGEGYANIMWIEGRKCLHDTHVTTLLMIFAPNVQAGDLRPQGPFLAAEATEQLLSDARDDDLAVVWRR